LVSSGGSFAALQAAFLDAHTHPEVLRIMQSLLLERFVQPRSGVYEPLRTSFEQSLDFWHEHALASIVHPAFL
jgi:hypothetical protein